MPSLDMLKGEAFSSAKQIAKRQFAGALAFARPSWALRAAVNDFRQLDCRQLPG
jgi:hypothetical protein